MSRAASVAQLILLALLPLASTACVRKGTHQVALSNLLRAEEDIEQLRGRLDTVEAEREQLRLQLGAERLSRDSLEVALRARISELVAEQQRTEQRRETAATRFEQARQEVERLEALLSRSGAEYQSLQRRLESLRAIEREVRDRNAIYEDVVARFQSLMDGGQLSVSIVRGRLVINLPQDILFESGSATLGREGQGVISQVGVVLSEFPERRFQVEGHTDNVPIATARFASNWELSSARALAVVRLLAQQGVPSASLSGAAYGEHQPVAANEDRESRRLNRRIEIVMLPNLDVIATAQVPGGQ